MGREVVIVILFFCCCLICIELTCWKAVIDEVDINIEILENRTISIMFLIISGVYLKTNSTINITFDTINIIANLSL